MHNDDKEPKNSGALIIIIISNYLFYCFAHVLGINYIFTYIIYQDAMINPAYINKDEFSKFNLENIITTVIVIYTLLYIQQVCLSINFTRHIFGICITTQITTLIYLYSCVSTLIHTICEHRELLSCNKSVTHRDIDNTNLFVAQSIIFQSIMVALMIHFTFIFVSFIKNLTQSKYYFHENRYREFITYYAFYFAMNLFVFILPVIVFICMITGGCGGCDCNDSDDNSTTYPPDTSALCGPRNNRTKNNRIKDLFEFDWNRIFYGGEVSTTPTLQQVTAISSRQTNYNV